MLAYCSQCKWYRFAVVEKVADVEPLAAVVCGERPSENGSESLRLPLLSASEIKLLRTRLEEAIAWCLPRATSSDPERSTRTKALEPSGQFTLYDPPKFSPYDPPKISYLPFTRRRHLVDEVCELRARSLQTASGVRGMPVGPELAGGRLLVSKIDGSDWSGLPMEESKGFFDSFEVPGWDTWLWMYQDASGSEVWDCVLCWVPPAIVPLAQRAIEFSILESLAWVEPPDGLFE
jgi:hypothetical protein